MEKTNRIEELKAQVKKLNEIIEEENLHLTDDLTTGEWKKQYMIINNLTTKVNEKTEELFDILYSSEYEEEVKKQGRPTIGTTRKISLTLTDQDWAMIEKLQRDHDLKRSTVIRELIEDYFDHYHQQIE